MSADARARAASLRRQLFGTDRRSIGSVPLVVRRVLREPALISALVTALEDIDPVVRMRAADALEKVTARHPHLLRRWTTRLLRIAGGADQQEVRWHLAQVIPRMPLTQRQRMEGMRTLRMYLQDRSSIVRTFTLEALADLSERDGRLRRSVDGVLAEAARSGTPAMRARVRRILARRARDIV